MTKRHRVWGLSSPKGGPQYIALEITRHTMKPLCFLGLEDSCLHVPRQTSWWKEYSVSCPYNKLCVATRVPLVAWWSTLVVKPVVTTDLLWCPVVFSLYWIPVQFVRIKLSFRDGGHDHTRSLIFNLPHGLWSVGSRKGPDKDRDISFFVNFASATLFQVQGRSLSFETLVMDRCTTKIASHSWSKGR